jgi:hypothetical protein
VRFETSLRAGAGRRPAQERPLLPSPRVPSNASSGPLNSIPAQAYRPFRLTNNLPPNTALQRTSPAAPAPPLSFGTLGEA